MTYWMTVFSIISVCMVAILAISRQNSSGFKLALILALAVMGGGMWMMRGVSRDYQLPMIIWACSPTTAIISYPDSPSDYLHVTYKCEMNEKESTGKGQPLLKDKRKSLSSNLLEDNRGLSRGDEGDVIPFIPEIPKEN